MKKIFKIEGMTCSACSSGLEKYLNKQKDIIDANVNLVLSTAEITYENTLSVDDINKYIKDAGFRSLGEYDPTKEEKTNKNKKILLIIYGIIAIILAYITMNHMFKLPAIAILNMHVHPKIYSTTVLVITSLFIIYGINIIKSGIKNLIHRTPNMDTLVTIGVFSTFLYSLYNYIKLMKGDYIYVDKLYFESAAIVIFFIKLGRYIDGISKDKTKEAIKDLVTITPNKAIKIIKNKETVITLDMIKKGDVLISKPGTKIAVDGIITKGSAHFDESFITGESLPVKKDEKDKVIAGSINYDGYIEYKAENIGRESTISNIVKLVLEATNSKPKIALLADKISGIFVPTIIIIAILSLIVNLVLKHPVPLSINIFVSVLVVACPCSLGLATPLAVIISEGLCAKNGILIKKGETIELLNKVDTVVFDKTGTLTYGNLKIDRIYNYSNQPDYKLLAKICSIEEESLHPISNAFIEYKDNNKLKEYEVKAFKNLDGLGIKGTIEDEEIYLGNSKLLTKLKIKNKYKQDEEELTSHANSIVYIVINKEIVGLIGVSDTIKMDAKYTVSELLKLGKNVIMLTGDNDISAKIIAEKVGIKEVIANVMPKEKNDKLKELKKDNKIIMMVGDGINDAPSLATADIGISIASGTDIANNSADVILLNDELYKIIDLVNISQKTIKKIKQNLFWAFFYNILMIPVALGLLAKWKINLNPVLASLAMTLSSITVLLNALKLKLTKLERRDLNAWKKETEEDN